MSMKKAIKWSTILIIYTLAIFISLLGMKYFIRQSPIGTYTMNLFLLSLLSALFPAVGGYFGRRLFFVISSVSILLGILYAFYVIVRDTAPGWEDLASLTGYVFITGIGIIGGFLAELLYLVIFKKHDRPDQK